MHSIYLIGSLRNPEIPHIANKLQEATGIEIFADWHAAGDRADDAWKEYSKIRGLTYGQALKSYAATHVFEFDKFHLDRADGGILVLPAGKSGHLELGYLAGQGKPTHILFEGEPDDRWDVMTQFASWGICFSIEELITILKENQN